MLHSENFGTSNIIMEGPKIKTYSRREPVTTFASAVTLVPSQTRFEKNGDIRPSCLNEKTLVVDNLDDTFDRLAQGVIIPSPKTNETTYSSGSEMSSEYKLDDDKRSKSLKRKLYSSDEDSDSNLSTNEQNKLKIRKIEKPKEDFLNEYFSKSNKRKVAEADIESVEEPTKCSTILDNPQDTPNVLVTGENDESKSLIGAEDCLSVLKEFPSSKNLPSFLTPSSNLPTSTPRGDRFRGMLDLKNISPISFNKENYNSRIQNNALAENNSDQSLREKCNSEFLNTNDKQNAEVGFLKPQSRALKSKAKCSNSVLVNSSHIKESREDIMKNDIMNKDNLNVSTTSEILVIQNDVCRENTFQDKNLSDQSLVNKLNDQSFNKTPQKNENLADKQSFVESPLLFDDTTQDPNYSKKSVTISSTSKDEIAKKLFESSSKHQESFNINNTNNESSYYPHEWSNEYDSSYEEFTKKDDMKLKSKFVQIEKEQESCSGNSSKLENTKIVNREITSSKKNSIDISEKKNNYQSPNKTSILSDKNVLQKEASASGLQILKSGDGSELFSDFKEQVTCSDDNNEENILNVNKNLDKVFDVPDSEIDSQNLNAYSCNMSDEKESENAQPQPISDEQLDTSESAKTNNAILDEELKKAGSLEDIFETDYADKNSSNHENMIKKTCPRNLLVYVKRLEDDDFSNRSPVLSKRSLKKRNKVRSKKSTKNVKNNRKKSDQNITVGLINNKQIYEDTSNLFPYKSMERSKDIHPDSLKIATVYISKEDIQNAENHLALLKDNQKQKLYHNQNNGVSRDNSLTDRTNNSKRDNENMKNLFNLDAKLKDPLMISGRRNVKKKLDRPLAAIAEADQSTNIIYDKKEILSFTKEIHEQNALKENLTSPESRKSKQIFLKPGKSWARSLSIINNFQNRPNLDELAVGRGQNWRQSVQTVLNMQSEDILESVSKKSNREIQSHEFPVPSSSTKRSSRTSLIPSIIPYTSPSRFSSLRFSMRIVPSPKRSTLTNDFMERISSAHSLRKTLVTRKNSLKIRRDTLIATEDDLIKSAKDIVLKRCNQSSYIRFDECFPETYTKHCRKIGEGVYGEVFMYENGSEKSVVKIIPIEGDKLVNSEPQKKFHEILSEIIIAEELHKLRFGNECSTDGFVGVNRIMCVVGKYPDKLIELWENYDEEKTSENDCPSMFEDDQLFIILDLAHGGQDLEAYTFQNASESYSIFLQTAFALAVAERLLDFEHRDLHWGNILISKTHDKSLSYKIENNEVSLLTKGVKVSVIDFTLSRMSYKGCRIFNDLAADPSLFEAQGEYQFDIYRMMRDTVNNDWQQFNPHTNILWLDYTLDKMINAVKYKRKTTKIHKTSIDQMKGLRKEIFKYKSAFDLVHNCNEIKNLYKSD